MDRLLNSPDVVRLLPFDRAPALARRHEALSDIVLLRGVVDIGKNLPATDIPLVAPVAQLVVRKDLQRRFIPKVRCWPRRGSILIRT